MPILEQVADQWILFAVVLAAGIAAGWFARERLLKIRQRPILARLELADKFLLIDENDVARQVSATNKHIELLHSISEASIRAADLANRQMKDFMDRFVEIYGDKLVPELIRDATKE